MIETYRHENGEDVVEVDTDSGTFFTYTGGTKDPLYVGSDFTAARLSLEWDEETMNRILMSDPD